MGMANDGEIKIGTKIDESGLDKGLKNVKGKVNNAAKDMNKGAKAASSFTQKMGGIATSGVAAAAGIAGAVVAAKKFIDTMKEANEAYKVQEKAEKALQKAAENNPYLNGESVRKLKDYASELQGVSNYGDEVTIQLMSQLAASGRTEAEIMKIMGAAADVAASGQMSLSLELPVLIDASTRAKFVQASSEAMTAAVYAKLDGTDYYSIKGSAGSAAVKALWDKVVAANLIASQIVLSADQLNIAGKTVFTSTKTASAISTAQEAAAKDAEKTAASQRNEMAQKMGYSSYDDMVNKAAKGQTIIDGGYLRTSLIEVEKLLAQSITMKDGGSLQSANYKAGKTGWKISSNGSVEFSSGTFRGDLVGGKVYFSALGLYGLKPGDIENDVVFTASKNSSARFVFDCFNSTVRIRMSASATSLADGECEIDFYMKENESVGQYNFDGTANITWSKKGTHGLTKSFDVAAYEPGQYVEVMFKVSSATAGVGFNSVKAEVRLDEKKQISATVCRCYQTIVNPKFFHFSSFSFISSISAFISFKSRNFSSSASLKFSTKPDEMIPVGTAIMATPKTAMNAQRILPATVTG